MPAGPFFRKDKHVKTYQEFAELVERLRKAQRDFFSKVTRTPAAAKGLEREVDQALEDLAANPPQEIVDRILPAFLWLYGAQQADQTTPAAVKAQVRARCGKVADLARDLQAQREAAGR